jgi:hypothetical protein
MQNEDNIYHSTKEFITVVAQIAKKITSFMCIYSHKKIMCIYHAGMQLSINN